MDTEIFPFGFPKGLAASAFISGLEAAWTPDFASQVVEWFGQNKIAVLGTELWIVRADGIQPGIYIDGKREIHGNTVSSRRGESWDAYVVRSVEETLHYLESFETPLEAKHQGEVFFNIVWANESDHLLLVARKGP